LNLERYIITEFLPLQWLFTKASRHCMTLRDEMRCCEIRKTLNDHFSE